MENNVFDFIPEAPVTFEIMPGMTVEEMRAAFFDKTALIEPPYKVFQLNSSGHRYYYRFNEIGEPEFFPSVTTILSQTLPKGEFLIKWIAGKGYEEANSYKQERADYGTFMHAQYQKLIITRTYDLDALKADLKMFVDSYSLPDSFMNYVDDLKKDVLSFAQFIIDYDVKPYAVEIALVHPRYRYAGMLDLPCSMLEAPGSKKRINALLDFKGSRKGFWEENEIQLHFYKDMWNENFPSIPMERVFNFSPKNWQKFPTYNLKDQTFSTNAKKVPHLLALAAIEDEKRGNIFTATSGLIDLHSSLDLKKNVTSLTLSELVKSKKQEKAPEAPGITETDLQEPKPVKKAPTKQGKRKAPAKKKKQPNTSKKVEKPVKAIKTPKTDERRNLLNDDPEI